MWESVILHDFPQEERRQQFHNQLKAANSNQMTIIRGGNCKLRRPQIQGQGHKTVTSEAEANEDP